MITTNTGAKKIEGTDNWRGIFDAHNDSVDAHDQAIAKQEITLLVTITANGTGTKTITGMTADHVVDYIQFFTDSNLTTPSGNILADLTITPGAGTVSVTVGNKQSNCYVLIGFSYKPSASMETLTIS